MIDTDSMTCQQTTLNQQDEIREKLSDVVKSIESVPVDHVPNSKAFILTLLNDKYKLVYSGDCRPSEQLIERGARCDMLIHEATYGDVRLAMATNFAHSTISQAVQVGVRMQAKNIVLTHFSALLSTKSDLLYSDKWSGMNVIIAQDFMRINPRAIPRLKLLTPGLKLLNPISPRSTRADLFK